VLERAALPLGASTRNAGFACFGSPSELLHDAGVMGVEAMLQVVDMRFRGIQRIRETLGDAAIGFEPCGGYECYDTWPDGFLDQLAQLNTWLQPVMGTPAAFTVATDQMQPMGLQGFAGMVANELEGAVHSGQLVAALAEKIQQAGVTIRYGAEVQGWSGGAGNIEVVTSRGLFRTGQLVLATNAYLQQMAPQLGVKPARGQVILSKPIPGLAMQGTFHFDEGFYYWRHMGNRVLLGGARNLDFAGEETLEMNVSGTIQQALEQFLVRHLPGHFGQGRMDELIEMRWSGLMAMSPSKQPLLQALQPGIWAAMACNGMGVALTPVFGETVARAVLTA
jgi:glycine/D-amino acid oxidase-like deaminating enzyme